MIYNVYECACLPTTIWVKLLILLHVPTTAHYTPIYITREEDRYYIYIGDTWAPVGRHNKINRLAVRVVGTGGQLILPVIQCTTEIFAEIDQKRI